MIFKVAFSLLMFSLLEVISVEDSTTTTTQLSKRITRPTATTKQPPTLTTETSASTQPSTTTSTLDEPTNTSRRYTKALSTTAMSPTPSTTGCNCAQSTSCPPPDNNCNKASECQSDGTNLTGIYSAGVVKAELYARGEKCCPKNLVWGVVLTLQNANRWLIHDPLCNDDKCEMIVVDASCMSSDWNLLASRKITTSLVGDYVLTGNSGLNMIDCSESCKKMMTLT